MQTRAKLDAVEVAELYSWLTEVKCTTVSKVASMFGFTWLGAYNMLRRLVKRGALKKLRKGSVNIYCINEEAKLSDMTRLAQRLEEAEKLLTGEGCISTYTLINRLGVSHREATYVLQLLMSHGRAVNIIIGNTAVWCRNIAAAVELVRQLRGIVHNAAVANKIRFATPKKIMEIIRQDKEMRKLFGRFVSVDSESPVAYAFISWILRSMYEPIHRWVYLVAEPKPLDVLSILRGGAERRPRKAQQNIIKLKLPQSLLEDLDLAAEMLGVSRSHVMRVAIRRLIEMYKDAPPPSPRRKRKPRLVAVRVPQPLLEDLEKAAAMLGVDKPRLIRMAIERLLQRHRA